MAPTAQIRHSARLGRSLAQRVERGMTTAEYAVGTIAVILFGGLLARIFDDELIIQKIFRIAIAIYRTILMLIDVFA